MSPAAEVPRKGDDAHRVALFSGLLTQPPLTPHQGLEPFLGKSVDVYHRRLVPHSRIWKQRIIT